MSVRTHFLMVSHVSWCLSLLDHLIRFDISDFLFVFSYFTYFFHHGIAPDFPEEFLHFPPIFQRLSLLFPILAQKKSHLIWIFWWWAWLSNILSSKFYLPRKSNDSHLRPVRPTFSGSEYNNVYLKSYLGVIPCPLHDFN